MSLKAAITLEEIVVTDKKFYQLQEGLSIHDAPNYASGKLQKMPSIGGEPDIVRYFQTLPGVESGSGSFGGMHVRGGEAGQNLVLLDGVPVYNIGHSLGIFSIFNENIIKNARMYKGKFPAKFGGRLSSVVDIQTKDGNDKEFKFGGGIGLIATTLFAEGPIKKEKTSFFVSARRTHLDPLLNALSSTDATIDDEQRLGYYFYDINAKVNHRFSDKDRVYISFYDGADNFKIGNAFSEKFILEDEAQTNEFSLNTQNDFIEVRWGNTILSTRWNRVWNNKLFSNATFTYSEFGFSLFTTTESEFEETDRFYSDVEQYYFDSRIQDVALKVDFDYIPNPKHHLKFGGGLLERIFKPVLRYQEFEADTFDFRFGDEYFVQNDTFQETKFFATELNFYIEDAIKITDKLEAQIGFHNAIFTAANSAWVSFQPRLSMQYKIHPSGNIYTAYSRMGQFLHVLSPVGISMPFDLWVPSTKKVSPQQATQILLGTKWQLPADFTFGAEAYYKKLNHLITYRAGLNSILTGNSMSNFDWGK